jgi:predicted AlkP superfamily phosphohydrolase/phosphomutase
LDRICEGYVVEANLAAPTTDEERERLLLAHLDADRKRTRAMKHLLTTREWDFALLVYRATDVLAHFFWHYMDSQHPGYDPEAPSGFRQAIQQAYETVDEGLGELLEAAPEETVVVVVSDHGFGPRLGTFAINEWLREQGFLALQRKQGWSPRTFLARRNVTLHSLKKVFDRLGPLQRIYRVVPKAVRNHIVSPMWSTTDQGMDWSRTRAYAGNDSGMQIHLNVRGREPAGVVQPRAEYESLREEIAYALEYELAAQKPSPLSVEVYRREEIYWGPYLDSAPDLVVYTAGGAWAHDLHLQGPSFQPFVPEEQVWSGSHRSEGLFILSGEGIRSQNSPASAHILDLAPTILYLLGLPIPGDFDGLPLLEHLSLQHEASRVPVAPSKVDGYAYSPTEEAAVEQQLRNLGYL